MERNLGPEVKQGIEGLRAKAQEAHKRFLSLVPNFDRNVWLPYEAISNRGGAVQLKHFL